MQTVLELLKADRQRRLRKQQGTIIERSNALWLRFYRDGGDGTRVNVTEKLCDKTKEFYAADCHAVTTLRDVRIAQINADQHKALSAPTPLPQEPPLTIGGFWLTKYGPWIEASKRFSTVRGYKYVWSLYLKDELEKKALNAFTTLDASELLDRLITIKNLSKNTIASVRSLMSGIFKRTANTKDPKTGKAFIEHNPMRDAEISVRVRKPKPRMKYTLEEIAAILT